MAYNIEWVASQRILLLTLWDVISSTELHQIIKDIVNTLKTTASPIYLMLQTQNLEKFPNDIQENYKAFRQLPREKIDYFLLVSDDSVLQYVTSTASRLTGLRWRAYPNPTEAINFLKKVDTSIDWDAACGSSS